MVYNPREYSWAEKGMNYKVSASVVGTVFEQIEKEQGHVTREAFLEKSRPKKSPTHCMFEWDDKKAAENYRLNTATKIINSLRITYIDNNNEEHPVTAFIRTTALKEKPKYMNIVEALKSGESRDIILERIRRELEGFIERNKHIEELADILIQCGVELKAS